MEFLHEVRCHQLIHPADERFIPFVVLILHGAPTYNSPLSPASLIRRATRRRRSCHKRLNLNLNLLLILQQAQEPQEARPTSRNRQ